MVQATQVSNDNNICSVCAQRCFCGVAQHKRTLGTGKPWCWQALVSLSHLWLQPCSARSCIQPSPKQVQSTSACSAPTCTWISSAQALVKQALPLRCSTSLLEQRCPNTSAGPPSPSPHCSSITCTCGILRTATSSCRICLVHLPTLQPETEQC
jgi:hypothetical protein